MTELTFLTFPAKYHPRIREILAMAAHDLPFFGDDAPVPVEHVTELVDIFNALTSDDFWLAPHLATTLESCLEVYGQDDEEEDYEAYMATFVENEP